MKSLTFATRRIGQTAVGPDAALDEEQAPERELDAHPLADAKHQA